MALLLMQCIVWHLYHIISYLLYGDRIALIDIPPPYLYLKSATIFDKKNCHFDLMAKNTKDLKNVLTKMVHSQSFNLLFVNIFMAAITCLVVFMTKWKNNQMTAIDKHNSTPIFWVHSH